MLDLEADVIEGIFGIGLSDAADNADFHLGLTGGQGLGTLGVYPEALIGMCRRGQSE